MLRHILNSTHNIYKHSWKFSCILRHIQNTWLTQAYLEPQTYLASFRHVIENHSRAIYAYSEPYLGRFRHIYNACLFRHVMFHAYSGILSNLEYVIKQSIFYEKQKIFKPGTKNVLFA